VQQTGRKGSTLSAWKKTHKYKQNNDVIDQTLTALCHKVPLRPPHDPVHLGYIKKRVATKKHDIKRFSAMLQDVGWVSDVSKAPRCFAKSRPARPMTRRHTAEDMKAKEPL